MNSKQLKIGTLFLASVLASVGTSAHADQINTGGAICHHANAGQANDFDYNPNAIMNANTSPRQIICPIPYSPGPFTFVPIAVSVDGHNNPNTVTSCTVTVFNDHNKTLASSVFSMSAPATPPGDDDGVGWHKEVLLSGDFASDTPSYISMTCTLPGNRNGTIRGVTALQ